MLLNRHQYSSMSSTNHWKYCTAVSLVRGLVSNKPGNEAIDEPGNEATDEPGNEATDEPGNEATDEPGNKAT